MPEITIEQTTFARLQRHALALVDTADTVVRRALDALDAVEGCGHEEVPANPTQVDHEVDVRQLPDVTHTKVLAARIGGEGIEKPNWNRLLDRVVVLAMRNAGSFDHLNRMCPVNMVAGQKTIEGYHYLSEIDVSVQGLSAKEACGALIDIARRCGTDLEITFQWRNKDGAERPGETRRLTIGTGSGAG